MKLDAPLDIYAVDWTVASAPSNPTVLTFSDGAWSDAETKDFYNNIYSGSRSADNINTDTIGTVTVTVPANAPAGTYTINVSGISIADMSGTYLLEDATATATITITDEETVGFNAAVTTDKDDYNAGETVTATVTLTREEAAKIRGYQFELGFDSSKLTLSTITMGSDFTADQSATNGNKVAGTTAGEGVEIGAAGKVLATVTFTVNEDVTDLSTDTITLNNAICSIAMEHGNELTSTVTGKTVTLHNIIVTLNADANSTVDGGASKTLYAKYNETGLYSDKARGTAVTSVAVAANEGYRLKDNNWIDEGSAEYADFAAIKGLTFTGNGKVFTLQTIGQYTITIVDAEHATTTGDTTAKTVDDGTLLSAAGLPTYTPEEHYAEDGWYVSEDDGATWTKRALSYAVHSNIKVQYKAIPATFNFTGDDTTGVTETIVSGVTGGKVTYLTDVELTYEYPGNDQVITGVTVTVGGTEITVTPVNNNGVWTITIPGDKITGDVVMSVSLSKLWKITFADNHTTDADATAYQVEGREGFYSTIALAKAGGSGDFVVPTPVAEDGYRLADKAGENLWLTDEASARGFTASTIATAAFTADTTVTAQVVKTWTVSYVAGANGDISGDADKLTLTVDDGTEISTLLNPAGITTTPDAGYKFKDWTASATGALSSDVTITANFEDASYPVTTPSVTGITVTPSGEGYDDSAKEATHGKDLIITVVVEDGYKATAVTYTINGVTVTLYTGELEPGTHTYTIPGDEIIGAIAINVEANATFNVTFVSADPAKGGIGTADNASTTVTFDENYELTAADVPTPVAKPGYKFDAWDNDPVGQAVTADVTYTATFVDASYTLTENGTVTEDGVTHGTDYDFTPTEDGKIVIGVTVTVGGVEITPVKNDDGSYTIPGDAIVGEVVITYNTIEATWEFITFEDYKGSKSYHEIAILKTAFQDGSTFRLNDAAYGEAYYSDKYEGYVWFVYQVSDGTHAAETEATLSAKLVSVDGSTATKLTYENGDINGTGIVTAADAGIINDVLHQNASTGVIYTISDKMRFELDVMGDKSVTAQDVQWILDEVVGKTH